MAYLPIRYLMLQQLASADLTVTAIAERIGAIRNSVAKSMESAHEQGIVHIAGYDKRIPIYRRGAGLDSPRPPAEVLEAPEAKPVAPVVPVPYAGLEYFEMADLLPGVTHFMCSRYRSTLSVASCADRYQKANATSDPDLRLISCRGCAVGASHCGQEVPNESRLFGKTLCARCRTGATRLIGKHICPSCFNRAREFRIGRNGKGTVPRIVLEPRSISYLTAGEVKTRTLSESLDNDELVIAVLRDSKSAVAFGFRAPAAMDWLLGDEYDRSIGDAPGDISVTPEAVTENTAGVPAPVAEVVTDVECDAEPATSGLDMLQADPYEALRAAFDQLDTAVPVCVSGMSRRAARKLRQEARRQVRVSNLTVAMLRVVGAVRAPLPIVAPLPVKLYSPLLFAM
ncbi:hypothetical protein SAMN05414139_01493 [Burkholderia sp. D7]|nr:hypothetical protein SAMN05414139_01493 [Burkholderia sp. D7]